METITQIHNKRFIRLICLNLYILCLPYIILIYCFIRTYQYYNLMIMLQSSMVSEETYYNHVDIQKENTYMLAIVGFLFFIWIILVLYDKYNIKRFILVINTSIFTLITFYLLFMSFSFDEFHIIKHAIYNTLSVNYIYIYLCFGIHLYSLYVFIKHHTFKHLPKPTVIETNSHNTKEHIPIPEMQIHMDVVSKSQTQEYHTQPVAPVRYIELEEGEDEQWKPKD